jgi:hypothetical protein
MMMIVGHSEKPLNPAITVVEKIMQVVCLPNKRITPMTNTPTQENEELLLCSMCGEKIMIRYEGGTCVSFMCTGCGLIDGCEQICDHMTQEERQDPDSFDEETRRYSMQYVSRAKVDLIKRLNARPSPSTVSNRELVEEMMEITVAMLPNSTILDEAQEVDAEREERITEALNRAITTLSSPPVSTQTDNAELVERAERTIDTINKSKKQFPLDVIDLIYKMKEALTQVSPSEGVVISKKRAEHLVKHSKRDYDQRVDFALAEVEQALQEHDNG